MPIEMKGRRVKLEGGQDPYDVLKEPGDYCGPVVGWAGTKPAVHFLLPIAGDEGVPEMARNIHHVVSPPHVFTEEPDGTLTIRDSIGAGPRDKGYYWHGYLTRGNWQLKRD